MIASPRAADFCWDALSPPCRHLFYLPCAQPQALWSTPFVFNWVKYT